MKHRLYLAAVNNRYGRNVFLPYAAGLIWAAAKARPEVEAKWEVPQGGILYLKEAIASAVSRLDRPDVVALSGYIWNWQWCKAFAKAVKAKWPSCATIIGGVQVLEESPKVLLEHPEFDYAIYGEGEGAFGDFLAEFGTGAVCSAGSLIWRDAGGQVHVNPRREQVSLDDLPSPYLTGIFDELVKDSTWQWQALQETNRGCPYHCSFCAWGVASQDKVRKFPEARILAEYQWMADHKVSFLYNCDANYGILPRDVNLTEHLVAAKDKHGYPQQFRAAFAKNSNDVVFGISKTLSDAKMLKATTLALQSMDEGVLVNIQRKNIRYDKLAELSAKYEAAGIPTYAEIIVGLPGETLDSFIAGLDRLLEAGQHDSISIYLCMLLENTELASPASRARYGIRSVPMQAMLYHGTPSNEFPSEIQDTIIATSTMSEVDLRYAVLYGWVVQAFHGFGLTQHIARTLHDQNSLPYSTFYRSLLDFFLLPRRSVSAAAAALGRVADLWDQAVTGGSWNAVDPRYGDVSWPPEELLFLDVACAADAFYTELATHTSIPADLVEVQRSLFQGPLPGEEEVYAREAVWFGRKGPGARLRRR